jgi:uncharacterized protein (TIGR02118 family)
LRIAGAFRETNCGARRVVSTSRFIYDIPQFIDAIVAHLSERQTKKEIPMVELIVLYKTPNDPEHFEKYYREVHGPMTTKLAGVKSYSYGPVRAVDGGAGEFFWYWSGTFDSTQAAIDAMASPEGQAGAADVPNYYHDVPLFMFFEK